jgi:hypothetical protein
MGQPFEKVYRVLAKQLLEAAPDVETARWQGLDISSSQAHVMRELMDVSLQLAIPTSAELLANEISPNLPWAEDHFLERVSGIPMNPPPSAEWWPWAQKNNDQFKSDQRFSHTYPERFWPRRARAEGWQEGPGVSDNMGIRFRYGDLDDVVRRLTEDITTRQAYLPVWFPEDTGCHISERVPCTLGYHFIFRKEALHATYYIRSCDLVRHFRDDVYMAGRLQQWVAEALEDYFEIDIPTGNLTMHITSLHCFRGDVDKLREEARA